MECPPLIADVKPDRFILKGLTVDRADHRPGCSGSRIGLNGAGSDDSAGGGSASGFDRPRRSGGWSGECHGAQCADGSRRVRSSGIAAAEGWFLRGRGDWFILRVNGESWADRSA